MKILVIVLLLVSAPRAEGQALRDSVTECWMKAQMSLHEEGFRLDNDGGKIVLLWVPAGNGNHSHLNIPIGRKTVAMFHTHFGEDNYRPSPEDIESAKAAHISVYVISEHAVWVADPTGKVAKFADR